MLAMTSHFWYDSAKQSLFSVAREWMNSFHSLDTLGSQVLLHVMKWHFKMIAFIDKLTISLNSLMCIYTLTAPCIRFMFMATLNTVSLYVCMKVIRWSNDVSVNSCFFWTMLFLFVNRFVNPFECYYLLIIQMGKMHLIIIMFRIICMFVESWKN